MKKMLDKRFLPKYNITVTSQEGIGEHSSAGRALALQARGHRFEPCCSHHYGPVVQLVRMPACHAGGQGFEPPPGRQSFIAVNSEKDVFAGVAHSVERCLAKAEVAGSSPVSRSNLRHHSQAVRQRSAKPLFPGSIPGGASNKTFTEFDYNIKLRFYFRMIGAKRDSC